MRTSIIAGSLLIGSSLLSLLSLISLLALLALRSDRAERDRHIRDYVTEMRLLAAADRIRSSYDRISEIAWNVGFTDLSNFDHAFRKRFGASPTEYRDSLAAPLAGGD